MSETACDELFEQMVESVGVKAFAADMGLSSRQVYRMLNGVQANPVERFRRAMTSCQAEQGDAALDYLCRLRGGYFVRRADDLHAAGINAVKESAEAIVAISEGRPPRVTIKEIREAISALAALELRLEAGQVRWVPPSSQPEARSAS